MPEPTSATQNAFKRLVSRNRRKISMANIVRHSTNSGPKAGQSEAFVSLIDSATRLVSSTWRFSQLCLVTV